MPDEGPPRAPAVLDTRARRTRGLWPLALALAVFTTAAVAVPLGSAGAQTHSVVLMGDSLLAEAAGDITTSLEAQGDTVDASAAVPGAGLLDTGISWLSTARSLVAKDDPDVVVVEYVGNYGYFGGIKGVSVYTRAFYRRWAAAAQRLEDVLTSRGATVYWVIGPPVDSPTVPKAESGIVVFDRAYANLHAPHTVSGRPPLIDVTPAVTGGTGTYEESIPNPAGGVVQVRQRDGVHFTAYGASLFAGAIVSAVG